MEAKNEIESVTFFSEHGQQLGPQNLKCTGLSPFGIFQKQTLRKTNSGTSGLVGSWRQYQTAESKWGTQTGSSMGKDALPSQLPLWVPGDGSPWRLTASVGHTSPGDPIQGVTDLRCWYIGWVILGNDDNPSGLQPVIQWAMWTLVAQESHQAGDQGRCLHVGV